MRHASLVLAALGVAAVAGCSFAEIRGEPPVRTEPPAAKAPYLEKIAVAEEEKPPTPTAVESALAWSEKYARAMEDLSGEQQKNRALAEENAALKGRITELQTALAQAQQELEEANSLLLEVRSENQKWKANVLGYRDEMRRAHLTELEALAKVLKLLGGEVPEPTPDAAAEPPEDASTDLPEVSHANPAQ